jgi:protein-S-isoprenylcysteine O-methyltransferase Ste14
VAKKLNLNKYFPYILVTLQMSAILFILLTGAIIPSGNLLLILLILFLLVGLWAMAEMKFRFNIFPALLNNSSLITSGPYRFIRNPMYTSIIFMMLILVINEFSYIRMFIWIILIFIFLYKINIEEKILAKEFPEYPEYRSVTKKLIPFIF